MMRVKRKIKNQSVSILINSRSAYNFIDPTFAKRIQYRLMEEKSFEAMVVNESKVATNGKCSNLLITIQGFHFKKVLYTIPIRDYEVVLGAYWLHNLRSII